MTATAPPAQDTTPDELLSAVMTAVLQDVKLSPAQLGDICVGEHLSGPVQADLAVFTLPRPPGTFCALSRIGRDRKGQTF